MTTTAGLTRLLAMNKSNQTELIFEVPGADRWALADAVYKAGFRDAVVGLGAPGLVAVTLDADAPIDAPDRILAQLPTGSKLLI